MGRTFESQQGYGDDLEIGLDNFEFKSAGKKYINQNYKRIGAILGVEGEGLGVIKKQANRENKLPDIHGEIGLEQINFYRAHYDFSPLTQDEYETVKAQNTSSEAIIDEQVEEVTEVEKTDIDISSDEGEKVESIKTLTRKDFGPMPEDPYNIKNNDLQALNQLFNLKNNEFPNNQYVDIRNWSDWTPITVVKSENTNDSNPKWSITKGNNNELIREFDSEQRAETEFKRIKDIDKQKALGLLRKARNFAIGEDLDTPWTNATDVGSETPSSAEDTTPTDTTPERLAEDEEVSEDKLPGAEALQAELDRLIEESVEKENNKVTETVGKLARIEGREYTGEVDSEEIVSAMEVEILRENARQSILEYQKFIEINRNNLKDEKIYNQYRIIEKKAWSQVSKFTHKLGGEMATLSQERDIQLAHPEVVDIEKYLVDGGKIVLDAEGHITHLNINGNIIELNRPRTIDELLRAPRPTRILYHSGTPISEDDPTKQNYKGLVISGLNENTLEWIEGVLSDKQFLESVIVDETTQQNPELDGNQEEVAILGNAGNVLDSETVTQSPEQAEGGEATPQVSLDDLRLAYARAEEAWNRKPGDEDLEDAFELAREAYNAELERVLKSKVAEGQESSIHDLFKKEVIDLREKRITQSKELQGDWEKKLNPLKEKFVNFVMKHKKFISRLNLAAGVAGGALALTGVGIPLAGGLAVARRMVSATLLGVSTGEGIRSLGEDADINSFWGKIKFQAVIPKLVQESLASSEDEFKQVSEDVLKERLGTLEAYYRLNGGKFFNDNQQQAYEKVLTELARRVQENVIYAENNKDTLQSDWQEQKPQELTDEDIKNPTLSIQPLTTEQLEKNKKLYGWGASYELAKIAKNQNIDLSLLSREDYADFAIQNKLMIEDTQLRMSPWQRMCESVDEVRKGDKERQALINPEADRVFDKFSLEIRQKAGEIDRNIDDNIIVRQGTNNSEHWLYFGINQGADNGEDQIFKSYISLQDLNTLTPDKFTDFMKALRDSGYNGDIKVFQDLLSQGIRLNDQIVMHGASEADAKLGLDVADQFFGDSLTHKSSGIDRKINGKSYSYSQVLAQNIKKNIQDSSSVEKQNPPTEVLESGRQKLETDRYASELLNTISDKRVVELDKFRRNRRNATLAGLGVGLLAGGVVHLLDEVNKPDSVELTDSSGSPTGGATPDTQAPGTGPGGAGSPEADTNITPETTPPPAPDLPSPKEALEMRQQVEQSAGVLGNGTEEALRQAQAAAAAAEQAQELAQDVSSLDSGETIWGEITKQLGENASDTQIQQAVENYLQSDLGQEAIYKLAQGTEGGRELLDQWGIDNAGDMAGLSKEQLFEISRYLAPGELEGLTELSLDNLNALEQAEYTDPSPTEAPTIEPASTEAPAPGTEDIGSKPPAPSSPPAPEVPPVAINEFTKGVSEALGANSLTEAQLQEVIHSFATSEQGSVDLYNQIISNEEGARFLSGFGVNNAADFANLRPDKVYEIAQTVGVENLDKLPGFELNEIILSKFEDAPDVLNLVNGAKPLTLIDSYIAQYAGDLPGSRSIGKLALEEYVLNTDQGRKWLYYAIADNEDKTSAGAENLQKVRELFSRESIKSPDDLKRLLVDSRGYPSARLFWDKLSWVLNPGPMPGIKEAVRQVLTR